MAAVAERGDRLIDEKATSSQSEISVTVASEGHHGHSHGKGDHGHSHGAAVGSGSARDDNDAKAVAAIRQLSLAIALCFVFMIAETVGGYFSGSIAIMTDAAHLLSDVTSLVIGVVAMCMARRKPSAKMTFGWKRLEVFGALVSVFIIWILVAALVYEAVLRIFEPEDVDGRLMFIVASIGLVVNIALMRVLHQGHGHSHGGDDHGHSHGGSPSVSSSGYGTGMDMVVADALKPKAGCCTRCMGWCVRTAFGDHSHGGGQPDDTNMNVRAAFIHALGDLIQSIGVMIAAGLIWYNPEWKIADPICTFLFSILVMWTTFGIVREASSMLLMSVPGRIDTVEFVEELEALPGVANVHDLHVWALTPKDIILTVHIVTDTPSRTLFDAQRCAAKHGISHTTIQIECCGSDDLANCWKANATCEFEITAGAGAGASSAARTGRSRSAVAARASARDGLLAAAEEGRRATGVDRRAFGSRSGPLTPHVGCSKHASADSGAADALAATAAQAASCGDDDHSDDGHGHGHSH
jgi:zinc transporter 2